MHVAHKNYGQYLTLVQQSIADIRKYSSNHLFIVILNETLWLWLFSSCFCFVHLGSHFAHLLWFCPKLGLCWFRWMPSGEICMHKWGAVEGVLLHCTAQLLVLVYYSSAHHAVCKYLLDLEGGVSLRTILY